MGDTLQKLGHLLLDSLPTILLFVGLHLYLKRVLYRPLRAVLAQRAALTTGRRQHAAATLAQVETRFAAYEAEIRSARVQGYRLVEARRQQALAAAQARQQQARHEAVEALVHARQQLVSDTTAAHHSLQATADAIATQVIDNVLGGASRRPGVGA